MIRLPHVNKRQVTIVIVAVAALLYFLLNIWVFFYGSAFIEKFSILKKSTKFGITATPGPTRAPTPIPYKLPSGRQEFEFISGGGIKGPIIRNAIVDPLTPSIGSLQHVAIDVTHANPVSNILATLITDHEIQTLSMKLASGSATQGTWTIDWHMTDTYDTRYRINFELVSEPSRKTGITLR